MLSKRILPLRSFIFLFGFVALFGFFLGAASRFVPRSHAWRKISSLANPRDALSWNRYEDLECPNPKKFKALAESFHFAIKPEEMNCDDPRYSKLGKVFLALEKISTKLPASWKNPSQEPLENSAKYVSRMARTMDLDLTQENTTVLNIWGNILLGAAFFDAPPLYALTAMIHESRHSDRTEPGHARCKEEGRLQSPSFCDEELSTTEHQGAFSLASLYMFGLAEYGLDLSLSDRQYLYSAALLQLATAFHRQPIVLNRPYDLIYGLTSKGQLVQVHPFLPEFINVQVLGLPANEEIVHISVDQSKSGLFLYTRSQKIWRWQAGKAVQEFPDHKLSENLALSGWRDSNLLFLKREDQTKNFLISNKNQIYSLDQDSETGTPSLNLFHYQPDSVGLSVNKIFMALGGRGIALSEEGDLFGVETEHNGAENAAFPKLGFNFERKSQDPTSHYWTFASGGILADALYGIANDSTAWQANLSEQPDARWSDPKLSMARISEPGAGEALQICEGTRFRSILGKSGTLYIKKFSEKDSTQIKPADSELMGNLLEHAIVQQRRPSNAFVPLRTIAQQFSEHCAVKSALTDPWNGIGIGLNRQGNMVFGIPQIDGNISCKVWNPVPGQAWTTLEEAPNGDGFMLVGKNASSLLLKPYNQASFRSN